MIVLKNQVEVEQMRNANQAAKQILDRLSDGIEVGSTTAQINDRAAELMSELGVESACLGYRGYPASICTSVNHVVCHGIPNHKRLKSGDILNVDVAVNKAGWFGDTSRMFVLGDPTNASKKIVSVALDCLWLAIERVRPGVYLGDIGHAIQTYAEKHGYSVVRDYCGHGIGRSFHEEPQVLHYGHQGEGVRLESGMTFTIEPMINLGKKETKVLGDAWTVITKDKKLSAQWEHSLAVSDNGVDVLSK